MTAQEVFNKVSIHLLTQNAKSLKSSGSSREHNITACSYRGDDGRMCAVGCLIPDERYNIDIEGYSVESYRVKDMLDDINLKEHTRLLCRLQYVHDGIDVNEWRNKLKQVANEYSLNSSCLEKEYDKAGNI